MINVLQHRAYLTKIRFFPRFKEPPHTDRYPESFRDWLERWLPEGSGQAVGLGIPDKSGQVVCNLGWLWLGCN